MGFSAESCYRPALIVSQCICFDERQSDVPGLGNSTLSETLNVKQRQESDKDPTQD